MTKSTGSPWHMRWMAAAILAGLMILSALHGVAPHHGGQGPCVACQTLAAPALVPLADVPGRPPEPRQLTPMRRGDFPVESSIPRLRPLRAPPLVTPA